MAFTVDDRTVRRITQTEFLRMDAAGVFDGDGRIELIDGVLVEVEQSPEHVEVAMRLGRWLSRPFADGAFDLHHGDPVAVPDPYSLPEPDLMVQPSGRDWRRHPATALLAIEVAVSSVRSDLRVKTVKYAQACVAEYWVVDVKGRTLHVFSAPTADGYAKHEERPATGTITPQALEVEPLDLAGLFADLE